MSASQCALELESETTAVGTCLSPGFQSKLKTVLATKKPKLAGLSPKKQLLELANDLGVKFQVQPDADLLKSKEFRDFTGLASEADKELEDRFKPEGPSQSHTWLSNWNIADVLGSYSRRFHFFDFIDCAMMDFQSYDNDLIKFDPQTLRAKGKTCFACVLNTDVHTGRGKHWVALFCDLRRSPGTLEFFNSANRSPPKNVSQFFDKLAARLGEVYQKEVKYFETAGSIEHQKGNSECGLYALYYIWNRLSESLPLEMSNSEGKAARFVLKSRINDSTAYSFRQKVFLVCERCQK
jgi:hypothetical protein